LTVAASIPILLAVSETLSLLAIAAIELVAEILRYRTAMLHAAASIRVAEPEQLVEQYDERRRGRGLDADERLAALVYQLDAMMVGLVPLPHDDLRWLENYLAAKELLNRIKAELDSYPGESGVPL
jgi:hypothetical protein